MKPIERRAPKTFPTGTGRWYNKHCWRRGAGRYLAVFCLPAFLLVGLAPAQGARTLGDDTNQIDTAKSQDDTSQDTAVHTENGVLGQILPDAGASAVSPLPAAPNGPAVKIEKGQLQLRGAQNANPADSAWVAYIRSTNRDGSTGMNCTGALINTSWVITAKHCVSNDPRGINVALGAGRLGNKAISGYFLHPQADVALLKLLTPVSGVEPITVGAAAVMNGQSGLVYGWGGSNATLQVASHRVEQQCSAIISGPNATEFQAFCPAQPGQMLTYKTTTDAGATEHGDSGGPLVVDGKLVGTLLGGTKTGSYFVKLQELAPFIEKNAQIKLGVKPNPIFEYPFESRVGRISGANRVDTALSLFSATKYSGDSIVLATGKIAPDALSAAALVGATNAPVLLTTAAQVEQNVVETILRSGKHQVFVAGGQIRFRPEHLEQLRAAGIQIRPVSGRNRYQTAAQVARLSQQLASRAEQLDIVLVDAAFDPNVPDALAVGPAVAKNHGIILYTNRFELPPATSAAIKELAGQAKSQGKSVRLLLVGGWAKGAAAQAGIMTSAPSWSIDTIEALAGADRYGTAAQVLTRLDTGFSQYLVASGQNFADGLSACGYAHQINAGIMLSAPHDLPGSTAALIQQRNKSAYTLVGGTAALSRAVANAVGQLLVQ